MACLEIWVNGKSSSLKMTPFDISYTTCCQPTIVSIALSFTIFELLDVEK